MIYEADFETYTVYKGTTPVEAFVQGFYIENMYNESDNCFGVYIWEFFNFIGKINENSSIYFHNLSFDGTYIIAELLRRGYKEGNRAGYRHYKLIMDDSASIYSIELVTTKGVIITFKCSLKLLQSSIERLAKDLKMPILKLKYDYGKRRKTRKDFTDDDVLYIKHDVKIAVKAMRDVLLDDDKIGTALSSAGVAFTQMQQMRNADNFPPLTDILDSVIRRGYMGGICYVQPQYKGVLLNDVIGYDAKSHYPSQSVLAKLPMGECDVHDGFVETDNLHYIIYEVLIDAELNDDELPCVISRGYAMLTKREIVGYHIFTEADIEAIKLSYNIKSIEYTQSFVFERLDDAGFRNFYKMGFFRKEKYFDMPAIKLEAKIEINGAYGKDGTNPVRYSRGYTLDEFGVLSYTDPVQNVKKNTKFYLPVAMGITSAGRLELVKRWHALKKWAIYCDTDSIKLLAVAPDGEPLPSGEELNRILNITPDYDTQDMKSVVNIMGTWASEPPETRSTWQFARFNGKKNYACWVEDSKGKVVEKIIKGCGCPADVRDDADPREWKKGFVTHTKLAKKRVKGGVVLCQTQWEIK